MTLAMRRRGQGIARTMAMLCILLGMAAVAAGPAAAAPRQDATLPMGLTQADDEDADETPEAEEEETPEADDRGADDDLETYESPQYDGYGLEYDPAVWEVQAEDDDPDDPYDRIVLGNGISFITLFFDPDYADDELDNCVTDYVGGLEGLDGVSDLEPLDERGAEGEDDDRVWETYSYVLTDEDEAELDLIRYFECRALGDDVSLVVLHTALADDYDDEIEAREELLEGLILPGGGDDLETYESPQYGYGLEYDPAEWEVEAEDEDPDDPYDEVTLTNGTSIVVVTGNPDYADDELGDCVADIVDGLESDDAVSDLEPLGGRRDDGEEDDRVWATYAYTFTDEDDEEQELVRYAECRALGDGVTLAVIQTTLADDYDDEVEAREELLDGLVLAE